MARKVTEVLTCDQCGREDGVEPWTVTGRGRTSLLDLCAEHSQPLADLMERGSTQPRKAAPRGRGSGATHRVEPYEGP